MEKPERNQEKSAKILKLITSRRLTKIAGNVKKCQLVSSDQTVLDLMILVTKN